MTSEGQTTPLAGLRSDLAAIDAKVYDLPLEEALGVLRDARAAAADLAAMIHRLEAVCYERLGKRHAFVSGFGMVERGLSSKTDRFESRTLLRQVLERASVDRETGEVLISPGALASVQAVLEQALPITDSLGWRRNGLTELGIDWRKHHEAEEGRKTIKVL